MKVAIQRHQILNFNRAKIILTELKNADDSSKKEPKNVLINDANELLILDSNSIDSNGNVLDINDTTVNANKDFSLSKSQLEYVLRELSRIASPEADLMTKLSKKNIYSAYSSSTAAAIVKRKGIINTLGLEYFEK
jgi:hypothetical protein